MENALKRRSLLRTIGAMGVASSLPMDALGFGGGTVIHEVAESQTDPPAGPAHSINFGVIGLDHNHIMGMTAAVQRGGGKLVSVYSTDGKALAEFHRRFGDVKVARSENEILNDPSISLVAAAPIPDQRAPLGIRVMKHGKDYLSDKPGITSLQQLADVRKALAETRRKYAILFSERFEVKAAVKAGELVKSGAIGRVIQTVNLAPHQINQPGAASRPDWFWEPSRYGGILCDIGSHQADQFLYYTGSNTAGVTAAQVGNFNHPQKPEFQDFGDMMLHGNKGTGYVRVDWFTPDGLGTWGDGRLFIIGTEGYMELRKYADIAGRPGGNHLFVVDRKQARYIDCSNLSLPFGTQFVSDIVNRTDVAQNQEQALLATELVLTAQQMAKTVQVTA